MNNLAVLLRGILKIILKSKYRTLFSNNIIEVAADSLILKKIIANSNDY